MQARHYDIPFYDYSDERPIMIESYHFRERHDPRANYAQLDEAVAMKPPSADSCSTGQMKWVATTIGEMNKGIEAAGMYTPFGVVYEALSHAIVRGIEEDE